MAPGLAGPGAAGPAVGWGSRGRGCGGFAVVVLSWHAAPVGMRVQRTEPKEMVLHA